VRRISEHTLTTIDTREAEQSELEVLTMAGELVRSSHACLKVLADSCERDRLIARDEEARALSVRDNLRRRAKELALEPDQAQMWQDLSLQNGSLCSLLSRVSVLANEQLAMCVRSEAEIEALNVTTSLEEHWRDTVNKRDSARSSYIKLQDLYLHGMRSWQRQLDAAISKVDARLQSLRSLASEQQKQSHAMPASVNIDVAGDLDALFNSVRSVAHACSEAYAIRETESAIVQEEKRIADLRNQLHARTEETITGRRELELQERLRANREEAARALCELKGLNVDLKAVRSRRNTARFEMDQAVDELPFGTCPLCFRILRRSRDDTSC